MKTIFTPKRNLSTYGKYLAIMIGMVLAACNPPKKPDNLQAPLFDNLGNYGLSITTNSEMAQRFFNQGLNLTYGFNHGEAERSYREAIRLDSTCAMCYWGAAYVLGTNYNAAMEEARQAEAQSLTQQAVKYAGGLANWEKAVIEASVSRYSYEKTKDQSVLDKDYAQAMAKVYKLFPAHDDIACFYSESLMNLHPWDLYTKSGEPKPWTPDIVSVVEKVLNRNPEHPGANHQYIHVVEASATPERGLASADRLIDLVPGAGHLVHMPSHIYIRTGDYHKGSLVNEKAAEVDSLYITTCRAQGAYPLVYFPHNIHFLAATAAYEGRGETSVNAAFRVASHVDTTLIREQGMQTLQHYLMIPHYVLVKFNQWDYILTMRKPASDLVYPLSVWHYARGMAYAGKNELSKAHEELQLLIKQTQDSTLKNITIWDLNSANNLMEIAKRTLHAEILRKQGKKRQAIVLLKEAVDIEDKLNYNEPPDWFFSVRHVLGALLLETGQFAESEKVYKDDLFFIPKNGWALNGLYQSLLKQGKTDEAGSVKTQFEEAWKYADIELSGSEVNPIAYTKINDDKFLGTFMAGIPTITMCGPAKK